MATIIDYFSRIITIQKGVNYNFPSILNPPASIGEIKKAEDKLDLIFNPELIELYSIANGTILDGESTSGEIGLIPIHAFLTISDAIEYHKASQKNKDLFFNWIDEIQPGNKIFPFLEDGSGNCYWVDLNTNTPNYNKIYWTNTFGDLPDYRFNSLTNMLQVICECYETGIFEVDKDGYLECDYTRWGELAQKHNPDLIAWDRYLAE